MKKLITFLLLIFGVAIYAQVSKQRLRVCRSASMALSTSWQTVDFNGSCAQNINTFALDGATAKPFAYYDPATKLFKFSGFYDWNATIYFWPETIASLLTLKATLQWRFVIPNGVSQGVDFYFPYPEKGSSGAYEDIGEVTVLGTIQHDGQGIPLYIEERIRSNGFYIQVRLSNALALGGTCTINSCNFIIQD